MNDPAIWATFCRADMHYSNRNRIKAHEGVRQFKDCCPIVSIREITVAALRIGDEFLIKRKKSAENSRESRARNRSSMKFDFNPA